MDNRKGKLFFSNLDSLRFIAFLLVFLFHGLYNAFSSFEGENYFVDRLISFFFLGDEWGVQIFFVLSGFLITYILLTELQNIGKIDLKKFYLRRTLRIWPLYYATVFIAFLVYPFLKSLIEADIHTCARPWYYMVFLANFDVIHINQVCPGKSVMSQDIMWSVSIEEQFYLFWPLLFKFLPVKKHWLISPIIIIASLTFRIFNSNEDGRVLYFHTFAVMSDLAIGGLFAYLALNNERFLTWFRDLSKHTIIIVYLVIFVFYFFRDLFFYLPGADVYGRIIYGLCWIFIIGEQCFARHSLFPLGKIKLFSELGKISYGLYLLHPIGIHISNILFKLVKLDSNNFLNLILMAVTGFFISIFLAKLSFHFWELPFLKLKNNYSVPLPQVAGNN